MLVTNMHIQCFESAFRATCSAGRGVAAEGWLVRSGAGASAGPKICVGRLPLCSASARPTTVPNCPGKANQSGNSLLDFVTKDICTEQGVECSREHQILPAMTHAQHLPDKLA